MDARDIPVRYVVPSSPGDRCFEVDTDGGLGLFRAIRAPSFERAQAISRCIFGSALRNERWRRVQVHRRSRTQVVTVTAGTNQVERTKALTSV